MIKKLAKYFNKSDEAFVLLFGSYANKEEGPLSDVDVGIYFKDGIDVKTLGFHNAMLEKVLGKKIDLISLNGIEKKDPLFAFNILQNHQLLHLTDEEAYINFKTSVQLSFLDNKALIEQNMRDLQRRINNNEFAKRNYA